MTVQGAAEELIDRPVLASLAWERADARAQMTSRSIAITSMAHNGE